VSAGMSVPGTSSLDRWTVCLEPRPQAEVRLFFFPYAGGGSAAYAGWRGLFPAGVEMHAICLPGRESRLREPPLSRLGALVEALDQALVPLLDLPFAFFGHSLGALVSFELARRLRRRSRAGPLHLFVSGCRAPQSERRRSPKHGLADAAFIAALQALNGTPRAVLEDAELMQCFLPSLRADFTMFETYSYANEAPLVCPIVAFGGLQDPEIDEGELTGWKCQTSASFAHYMFAGDHFFLQDSRLTIAQAIVRHLGAHLARGGAA
jgi:medium-chain acyl-[acyl-carrier-protein] hydrolase